MYAFPPSYLFLDVENAAASQLAEALARRMFGARCRVASAGRRPTAVHPLTIEALAELGIEAGAARARSVDEIDPSAVSFVITLCDDEVCPDWPVQLRKERWTVPDPAAAGTREAFQRARDAIARRLLEYASDEPPEGLMLRPAMAIDRDEVRALVVAAGLPPDGLDDQYPDAYRVARIAGTTVGVAALERHGAARFLRSVAVPPAARGHGVALALVARLVVEAGADPVYLLTTGAADYFTRLGFVRCDRAAVPAALAGTVQFTSACPSSATAMVYRAG